MAEAEYKDEFLTGGAKAAASGAALGASVGSAVPVIGTAVGAAAGAAVGFVAGGLMARKEAKELDEIEKEQKELEQSMREEQQKASKMAQGAAQKRGPLTTLGPEESSIAMGVAGGSQFNAWHNANFPIV